jgi:hypothetical protein
MPLRDHFRPPLDRVECWDGLYGAWPAIIVRALNQTLPGRYVAGPRVHLGSIHGYDVLPAESLHAVPVFSGECFLRDRDEYEVLLHDNDFGRKLVAVIEFVSPTDKDRLEHRRIFVAKCVALLDKGIAVTIVDLVTLDERSLYSDLLEFLDLKDPTVGMPPTSLCASSCRVLRRGEN